MEQEIEMEREAVVISAGGAVDSVNGMTGDVVLTTSDIENTSDYQTGTEVDTAIETAIAGINIPTKTSDLNNDSDFQTGTEVDTAIETAIAGIDIPTNTSDLNNDSDYQTGTEVDSAIEIAISGIDIPTKTSDLTNDGANGTSTYVEATALANEASAREGADNGLQSQIDALAAASDVTDVVGTKAALNAYDTSTLKDNDIIKVLQDESEDGATTYYRWSTTTQTFTLIGEEGPYYTKAAADVIFDTKADKSTTYTKNEVDAALANKQDTLTAGSNISIVGDTISATDTTYTAGNGLTLSGTEFSADTSVLATQTDLTAKQDVLTAGSNISIVGDTISATDTTYSNFVGTNGTSAGTAGLVPAPATTDADKFLKSDGTWATASGSSVNVVQTTGTSTTDVMSQKAVTDIIGDVETALQAINNGGNA